MAVPKAVSVHHLRLFSRTPLNRVHDIIEWFHNKPTPGYEKLFYPPSDGFTAVVVLAVYPLVGLYLFAPFSLPPSKQMKFAALRHLCLFNIILSNGHFACCLCLLPPLFVLGVDYTCNIGFKTSAFWWLLPSFHTI